MLLARPGCESRPGTWERRQDTTGGRAFIFFCPRGHPCSLSDYDVDAAGIVHPLVLCPVADCGFHEFVRLEGWTPETLCP